MVTPKLQARLENDFPILLEEFREPGLRLSDGKVLCLRESSRLSDGQKLEAARLIRDHFYGETSSVGFIKEMYFESHVEAVNILVMGKNGELLGISQAYIVSTSAGKRGLIYPITVFLPSIRGQGVYTFVANFRLRYAEYMDCDMVILWTPNPLIVKRNQAHGFLPAPEREVTLEQRKLVEAFLSSYLEREVSLDGNFLLSASLLPADLRHPQTGPLEDVEFMDYFNSLGVGRGGDRLVLFYPIP